MVYSSLLSSESSNIPQFSSIKSNRGTEYTGLSRNFDTASRIQTGSRHNSGRLVAILVNTILSFVTPRSIPPHNRFLFNPTSQTSLPTVLRQPCAHALGLRIKNVVEVDVPYGQVFGILGMEETRHSALQRQLRSRLPESPITFPLLMIIFQLLQH